MTIIPFSARARKQSVQTLTVQRSGPGFSSGRGKPDQLWDQMVGLNLMVAKTNMMHRRRRVRRSEKTKLQGETIRLANYFSPLLDLISQPQLAVIDRKSGRGIKLRPTEMTLKYSPLQRNQRRSSHQRKARREMVTLLRASDQKLQALITAG